MKINVLISESATKRQLENAKTVFGSKHVSIMSALEEASKENILDTPGLDAFLASFKLSLEDFEKVSSKVTFKKAVVAAKAFATAKTFSAKLKALKSIKYSSPKAPGEVVPAYKQKPNKGPELGHAVPPGKKTKSSSANNIDHLYNLIQEQAQKAGDLHTDISKLTASIGKNSVLQIGEAADPSGQVGIQLVCRPNDVYIVNKHEAPKLFKTLASKALQANPKASYAIFADQSVDGPFYSTKFKPVIESIALFSPVDSEIAFKHLQRLCS